MCSTLFFAIANFPFYLTPFEHAAAYMPIINYQRLTKIIWKCCTPYPYTLYTVVFLRLSPCLLAVLRCYILSVLTFCSIIISRCHGNRAIYIYPRLKSAKRVESLKKKIMFTRFCCWHNNRTRPCDRWCLTMFNKIGNSKYSQDSTFYIGFVVFARGFGIVLSFSSHFKICKNIVLISCEEKKKSFAEVSLSVCEIVCFIAQLYDFH